MGSACRVDLRAVQTPEPRADRNGARTHGISLQSVAGDGVGRACRLQRGPGVVPPGPTVIGALHKSTAAYGPGSLPPVAARRPSDRGAPESSRSSLPRVTPDGLGA